MAPGAPIANWLSNHKTLAPMVVHGRLGLMELCIRTIEVVLVPSVREHNGGA